MEKDLHLESIRNKFKFSLRLLIESNLQMRDFLKDNVSFDKIGKGRYLNDYATIKIGSCRAIGHTVSALELCSEIYEKVVYFGPNQEYVSYVSKKFRLYSNIDWLTHDHYKFDFYKFNCAIIDCYSFARKENATKLIESLVALVDQKNFTLLLLQ